TDDAVSRLPLEAGRAELLEEIISTVAPDRQDDEPSVVPNRHGRRWLVPLAAAAVVAGIAASSLWWHDARVEPGRGPGHADPQVATQPAPVPTGFRAVLDAPGWTVTSTEAEEDGYGEVNYDRGGGFTEKGGASFTITWYPARSYDS